VAITRSNLDQRGSRKATVRVTKMIFEICEWEEYKINQFKKLDALNFYNFKFYHCYSLRSNKSLIWTTNNTGNISTNNTNNKDYEPMENTVSNLYNASFTPTKCLIKLNQV